MWTQFGENFLWPERIWYLVPRDRHEPTLVAPIVARQAEISGLCACNCRALDKTEVLNPLVIIGEHHIARIGKVHVLVKLISGTVLIPLWRPHVTAADFVLPSL